MRLYFTLALKELLVHKSFSLFFVFNLVMGLLGLFILQILGKSVDIQLQQSLKKNLAADISISSNSVFTEEEEKIITQLRDEGYRVSKQISFFSIILGKNTSRLSQIVAVDENYPLYGQFFLQDNVPASREVVQNDLIERQGIWTFSENISWLEYTLGEKFDIGDTKFELNQSLFDAPAGFFGTFAFTPRFFISLEHIEKTNLILPGSRIRYQFQIAIPSDQDSKEVVSVLKQQFLDAGMNPDKIRFRTIDQSTARLSEIINYVAGYLGLVAIIGLFLAGLGSAFLFRNFAQRRIKQMAILESLGINKGQNILILIIQVMILGLLSSVFAITIMSVLIIFIVNIVETIWGFDIRIHFDIISIIMVVFIGIFAGLAFCIPILARIKNIKPALLFQESSQVYIPVVKKKLTIPLSYLPICLFMWIIAIYQTDIFTGSLFCLGFIIVASILYLVGLLIIYFCSRLANLTVFPYKLSLKNISRKKNATLLSFLAIALGAFLINIVPQIENGIASEVQRPDNQKLPSWFLFDIQEDQEKSLNAFLEKKNYKLSNSTAQVVSNLKTVNDLTLQEHKKNRKELTFRNRTAFNLSYREKILESEKIIEGTALRKTFEPNTLAEISIEKRFANRYGLKIGDILEFDVQEVPVKGIIKNIRTIKWNSFQPNFFIQFQVGVLDDAPKTFIANVKNIKKEDKVSLQNELTALFPNISVVDISQVVGKLLSITDKASWAISFMAWLAIITGLIVIFSLARSDARNRKWEMNLMKTLGATTKQLKLISIVEASIISCFAGTFGVLFSIIMSYSLSYYLFESLWDNAMSINLISLLTIYFLCVSTAYISVISIAGQKPWQLLKND